MRMHNTIEKGKLEFSVSDFFHFFLNKDKKGSLSFDALVT